jgi:hypothetical protein
VSTENRNTRKNERGAKRFIATMHFLSLRFVLQFFRLQKLQGRTEVNGSSSRATVFKHRFLAGLCLRCGCRMTSPLPEQTRASKDEFCAFRKGNGKIICKNWIRK